MKVFLMHRDRDFDPKRAPPWNAAALAQDLELDTLLKAMADGDPFLFDAAESALFAGLGNDAATILYRQAILRDCLEQPQAARELYRLAVEGVEGARKEFWGRLGESPDSVLFWSRKVLEKLAGSLRGLRRVADEHASRFKSEGFRRFLGMLREELDDAYLDKVEDHLERLRLDGGVLQSARLGKGFFGADYVLRKTPSREVEGLRAWLEYVLPARPPGYTYHVHPRDESGLRALSRLKDRGIHRVANAIAQSADHVQDFFALLRTELAFYVACLNLRERLAAKGGAVCFPAPEEPGSGRFSCAGLYDACLCLKLDRPVVVNSVEADGRRVVIVTGANQGGKSSFLRGAGLAQLMTQAGMFAAAESLSCSLCDGLFTHCKREEDPAMKSGKLDEELARMSAIVDGVASHPLLLFNESFASTNEREGSEIASQLVAALLETRARVIYVTHLYEFARGFAGDARVLSLRAERLADGTRTFKLVPGEPLQTSFGMDLYREIFGAPG